MASDEAQRVWDLLPTLIALGSGIAFLFAYGGCAAWAVGDAQKRGNSGVILILLWLFGPLSALAWLLFRPRTTLAERPVQEYTNADDALAAAAKLDMLGDWDEAIALYQSAAARWPEHGAYVTECMKSIDRKKGGLNEHLFDSERTP
jgi:hypothetical protein